MSNLNFVKVENQTNVCSTPESSNANNRSHQIIPIDNTILHQIQTSSVRVNAYNRKQQKIIQAKHISQEKFFTIVIRWAYKKILKKIAANEQLKLQFWTQLQIHKQFLLKQNPDLKDSHLAFTKKLKLNENHVALELQRCEQFENGQSMKIFSNKNFPTQLQGKISLQEWQQIINDLEKIKITNYCYITLIVLAYIMLFTFFISFIGLCFSFGGKFEDIFSVVSYGSLLGAFLSIIFSVINHAFVKINLEDKFQKYLNNQNLVLQNRGCRIARDRIIYSITNDTEEGETKIDRFIDRFIIATRSQDIQPMIQAADETNYLNRGCNCCIMNRNFAKY